MDTFFSFRYEDYPFQLFSISHLVVLIITLVLLVLLYSFKNRIKKDYRKPMNYLLIGSLFFGEVGFHVWYLAHGKWDPTINLPFQLCSISLYLCTIMLITKSYRIFEVAFFVSMSGALIAMITPELFFGFPHFRFYQFFIAHIAIVISCFYMVWIEEYIPTFSSLIKSFITLNIIAVFVYIINKLLGSNYMFLTQKPQNASPIDYLGPYPWYILSLELIAFVLFSVIYGIIVILRKSKQEE